MLCTKKKRKNTKKKTQKILVINTSEKIEL